jgi:hypothetical protein
MTPIKFLLKKIRLLLLSSQREKNLAKVISKQILLLVKNKSKISILDYGSGFEPLVINLIYKNIKNKYKTININCCDYYTNSQIRKYDISICADVLHHVGVDNKAGIKKILIFLKNKSKSILIKDHYEYSAFSRQLLRFMDFVGNYYNGVNVPKKYFTKNSIANILKKSNLKLNKEINDYQYYSKMFLFFSNPKLHFIKILN